MNCQYCGEIIHRTTTRQNTQFCTKEHEKLWHKENRGVTFTVFTTDTPDIVEDRKARMKEYHKWHKLACAGDKEARRWLRQKMRLLAIWDNMEKREVRL